MPTTTEIFDDVLIAMFYASEKGDDVNAACNSSLLSSGANKAQEFTVISRLQDERLVKGTFDPSLRTIDQLTRAGDREAKQVLASRNELGSDMARLTSQPLLPISEGERRKIEPLVEALASLLASEKVELSPADLVQLEKLRELLNTLLGGPDPDRLVVQRVLGYGAGLISDLVIETIGADLVQQFVHVHDVLGAQTLIP